MSLEICYCLPRGDEHLQSAFRFLNTFIAFPPQVEHKLVILTDFGNEDDALTFFSVIPGVHVVGTPDHARDLSRYEFHARQSQAEVMMMLGGSTYCRRPGWGLKALTAFRRLGGGAIYGACGNTGAPGVHKHIRTTGWWAAPSLLRQYPAWPKDPGGRYEAEHGQTCITAWAHKSGYATWVVTFAGEFTVENAQGDPNGYGRGNHANLLIGDRLTAPPFFPFA